MIVRNESRIIKRLLDSVRSIVDFVIISDTGSTDNTVEIIETYLQENNLQGQVVHHTWKNFGHNRTLALRCAQESEYEFDYILLLDADMKLVIEPNFNKDNLTHDMYMMKQCGGNLVYYNTRLLRKTLKATCVGVTHEYYNIEENHSRDTIRELFIDDRNDGGCKADKFERDVRLLEDGIKEEPNNVRYHFYLARSYESIPNGERKAIEYFEKRANMGDWSEEIYISYYSMGNIYKKLHEMDKAIYYYLKAYNVNPRRVETIYKIAEYYRDSSQHILSNLFIEIGQKILREGGLDEANTLFVEKDMYTYLFDYEKTIVAYYLNKKDEGLDISSNLLLNKEASGKYDSIISNIEFYMKPLTGTTKKYSTDDLLERVKDFKSLFNPCVCFIGGELYCAFRNTNYRLEIRKEGMFYLVWKQNELFPISNENPLTTITHLCKLDENLDIVTQKTIKIANESQYHCIKGMEDVRIIATGGENEDVYFIGTSQDLGTNTTNKMCLGKLGNDRVVVLRGYGDNICQKNWSLFMWQGKLMILYSFDPLVILVPNVETGECTVFKNEAQKYNYSRLRGGSPGMHLDGFIYFCTHDVAYTSNARKYYHRIIKMDDNLNIVDSSVMFYIKKIGIEYVAGMVYDEKNKTVIISSGENDKYANITTVKLEDFMSLFRN